VFGERHLRCALFAYTAYYNQTRPHRSLQKDAPLRRATQRIGEFAAMPSWADYIINTSGYNFRKGQVSGPCLAGEIGRDLAHVDALDGERHAGTFGFGCDRVAALRLIAVFGRQSHVNVLASLMARPTRALFSIGACWCSSSRGSLAADAQPVGQIKLKGSSATHH
jgi:hypothetical protein